MHKLLIFDVSNFRSCKSAVFPLSDFTPLVGYNNGGKSNLLQAIKWLLRPYTLHLTDFNNKDKPVTMSGKVTGITQEILDLLIPKHRNRIEPFCNEGVLKLLRVQHSPGGSIKDIVLKVRDPKISDENDDKAWVENPTGIDAAIRAIFPEPIEIGAMENTTEDICKFKTNTTLGKLIGEIIEPIEEEHGAKYKSCVFGNTQPS